MRRLSLLAVLLLSGSCWAGQQYSASGMVLQVDPGHKTLLVSCDSIPDSWTP